MVRSALFLFLPFPRPNKVISSVSDVALNLPVMLKAKEDAVNGLTRGIETLFKQNKVDYIKGAASFVSPTKLSVKLNDGGETEVDGKNIIIATGLPGSAYPMISSVITFSPICWFVIAWIIPIGTMYTNAMTSARTNAQTGNCVGQTLMMITPKSNTESKMRRYHQSGTCA